MTADVAVRNTQGHPDGAFLFGSLADHFHYPGLVLVHYGERLSLGEIAVFVREFCHDLDGLTRSLGSLQCDVNQ